MIDYVKASKLLINCYSIKYEKLIDFPNDGLKGIYETNTVNIGEYKDFFDKYILERKATHSHILFVIYLLFLFCC
jgi:hypothetical protein